MTRMRSRGHHRRTRHDPAPAAPAETSVLAEPASCDMTVDELRAFLDRVGQAAADAGVRPGGLRLYTAVRLNGTMKGIWVRIPGRD